MLSQLKYLVTVIFCFHNSVLSFFILNEIFDMLQQQETLADKKIARTPISSGHGLDKIESSFFNAFGAL